MTMWCPWWRPRQWARDPVCDRRQQPLRALSRGYSLTNTNAHKQFYFRSRNTDGALAVHMIAGAPRGNNTLAWLIQQSAEAYPAHCHPTAEEL